MPGTAGPSPRRSTENGTPRSALTRDPSTLRAMLNAFSSARARVVREVEGLAHRSEEGGLGLAARPPVDVRESPSRVLHRVAHVGDVERAVPQVDPRLLVPGQDCSQSAHDDYLAMREKEL